MAQEKGGVNLNVIEIAESKLSKEVESQLLHLKGSTATGKKREDRRERTLATGG